MKKAEATTPIAMPIAIFNIQTPQSEQFLTQSVNEVADHGKTSDLAASQLPFATAGLMRLGCAQRRPVMWPWRTRVCWPQLAVRNLWKSEARLDFPEPVPQPCEEHPARSDEPDIFLSCNRKDQARPKLFAEAFEAQCFKVWGVGLRTVEVYSQATENAL